MDILISNLKTENNFNRDLCTNLWIKNGNIIGLICGYFDFKFKKENIFNRNFCTQFMDLKMEI